MKADSEMDLFFLHLKIILYKNPKFAALQTYK